MPLLNLGREAELTSGILKEEGGSIARQNQKKRIRGYLPSDPSRESLNEDTEAIGCRGRAMPRRGKVGCLAGVPVGNPADFGAE